VRVIKFEQVYIREHAQHGLNVEYRCGLLHGIPWIVTLTYRTVWALATNSPFPNSMTTQLQLGEMEGEEKQRRVERGELPHLAGYPEGEGN
jgi:hypothetical protein